MIGVLTRSNGQGGPIAVDALGPNGELVLVDGPSKDLNVSKTVQRLTDLKLAADSENVKGVAFFTTDTPAETVDRARKVLGTDNVIMVERLAYKTE